MRGILNWCCFALCVKSVGSGCGNTRRFDNHGMVLIDNFLLFTLIVSGGLFVQSAAGFAAGLMIIPLMGYAGYGIPEGQTVLLVATIPQNILGLWRFRRSLELRELALPVTLRFLGLPVGFGLMCLVDTLPLPQIRRILGLIILICVAILCCWKPQSDRKISLPWTFLSFFSSGFFAGLTGTGGPMMVAWVQMHHWSTEKTRAFLFGMYLIYTGPALALLWWQFGERMVTALFSVTVSATTVAARVKPWAHIWILAWTKQLKETHAVLIVRHWPVRPVVDVVSRCPFC